MSFLNCLVFCRTTPLLLLFVLLLGFLAQVNAAPPSPKPDFAGDWYRVTYFPKYTLKQTKILRRSDGRYQLKIDGKDWVLQRWGDNLAGRSFATASEIKKNINVISGGYLPSAACIAAANQKAFWFNLKIELGKNRNWFTESTHFTGRSFIYQKRIINFLDAPIIVGNPWSRKPPLSASYDWAAYIRERRGNVNFPFKELYSSEIKKQNRTYSMLWFSGDYKQGHEYLSINPLGKSRLTAKDAMVILKNNIETIFPDTSKGSIASTVVLDNVFELGIKNHLAPKAFVKVKEVGDIHFVFETVPNNHILRGTVVFGVFKDDVGELFLYQQGRGPADEEKYRIFLNYLAPSGMWKTMADNFKAQLASPSQAQPSQPFKGGGGSSGTF